MLNNKKGLSSSLVAIVIFLFVFAITTILVNVVWDGFNSNVQGLDESVADNLTKQQVDDLSVYIDWGDKLFMWFFIVLIISYLISASTLPTDQPLAFLLFMGFLIIIVLLSMILSNVWTVIANQPALLSAAGNIPLIDYILTFYPTIMFFVGVLGALIFFTRKSDGVSSSNMSGGADFE